jgi:TonB-dependent receptor
MRKLLIFLIAIIAFHMNAQTGRIAGTIIDSKTGEPLVGATAMIEGTAKGALADLDGKFSINNVPPGKVNVIINYVSYTTKKITDVMVKAGEETNVNVKLDPATSQDLADVEIVVTLNKENNTVLVLQQKNNASVSDGISAETIKRTPDRSTSDVLKRVSGAAIQDNKFAIVRGLNERYNAAYLNGAPLPSSESDRKAFAFDIFPSNMLDNLVITKTARPDLPVEFAGGIIDISTKSIPEKNFISVTAQGGYNTLATFKQKYYYQGGAKDWLGLDDGTRKLPSFMPDHANFPGAYDAQSFGQNTDLARQLAESPANRWKIYNDKNFAPNMAFQLSGGYNFKLKERDFFGVIAALTYNANNTFTTATRTDYANNNIPANPGSAPSVVSSSLTDQGYNRQVLAGALLNLSCKINSNNSISLKNLYSINSSDQTTLRTGLTNLDNGRESAAHQKSSVFWFTSNRIASSQLVGEHFLPAPKLRINWIGGYSTVIRDVPNMRFNVTGATPTDSTAYTLNISNSTSADGSYAGSMFWSHLTENIKSARADVQRDFKSGENFSFNLKLGGYYQNRARTFSARQFGYEKSPGPSFGPSSFPQSLLSLPADSAFTAANMGTTNGTKITKGGFILAEGTKSQDSYDASAELKAAYLMADIKISKWLRIVGGERVERYFQNLTVYTLGHDSTVYPSIKVDWLPSANLIFALNDKQNIRASYSKTLNRPEFRELAPFIFYDFNTLFTTSGKTNLQRALIENYDLRYEIFPGRGQLFSVSGFYKHFTDPIEQIASSAGDNEITYGNQPEAKVYGAELEGRVIIGSLFKFKSDSSLASKIFNNLTVFANYAYIRSQVQIAWGGTPPVGAPMTRPLQGQSPYIVNGGITYADNDLGYSLSAIVNRVGQRLYIVGNYSTQFGIWEQGRTVLDLQASKSFFKNKLEVRATVRDGLAKWQPQYLFIDNNNNLKFDKNSDDMVRQVHFGTTYALQITYRF